MGPLNFEVLNLLLIFCDLRHVAIFGSICPSSKKINVTLHIYIADFFYNGKQIFEKYLTMNSIMV